MNNNIINKEDINFKEKTDEELRKDRWRIKKKDWKKYSFS